MRKAMLLAHAHRALALSASIEQPKLITGQVASDIPEMSRQQRRQLERKGSLFRRLDLQPKKGYYE